jgi:hypothetical protein
MKKIVKIFIVSRFYAILEVTLIACNTLKYIKLLLHKKAAITRTTAFIKNDIDMCVGYIFSTINSLRLFF